MKMKNIYIAIILSVGLILVGCSNSEEPEIHEGLTASLSTEPTTITSGDTVEIEISIGEHNMGGMSGLLLHGELHMPNDAGEIELDFHESSNHTGHYKTECVFAISGMYELHSRFMHDNENVEEIFTIYVQ